MAKKINKTNLSIKEILHHAISDDNRIVINNNITIKGTDVSLANSNLGVNFLRYSNEPIVVDEALSQKINVRLDKIKELVDAWNFIEASKQYLDILQDYHSMNKLSLQSKGRLYLGLSSCYLNMWQFDKAESFLNKYDEDGIEKTERYYEQYFTLFFNQEQYGEAYLYAKKMADRFPDSLDSIIPLALTCAYTNELIDGVDSKEWLDKAFKRISNESTQRHAITKYTETCCVIFLIRKQHFEVINLYKKEKSSSVLLKVAYIKALFLSALGDGEDGQRSSILFDRILNIWNIIQDFESTFRNQEDEFFYRNIADIYFNCMLFLDKITISHLSLFERLINFCDDEMANSILENLVLRIGYDNICKLNIISGDKNAERLLELSKIKALFEENHSNEAISYLWPTIKMREELVPYFRVILLSACLENLDYDQNEKKFLEIIEFYKTKGYFDLPCRFLEAIYTYKKAPAKKTLLLLKDIFEESNDPCILLDIIRFYCSEKKFVMAFECLSDIFNNKKFVIEIHAENFFECYYFVITSLDNKSECAGLEHKIKNFKLSDELQLKIQLLSAETKKDYPQIITCSENLYRIRNNPQYLFKAVELSYLIFQLDRAKKNIDILERCLGEDDINVNMLKANCFILEDKPQCALVCAKKAKDVAKDIPKSSAHPFFAQISLRLGKSEGLDYIYEYSEKYPLHDDWLKKYTAIQTDSHGNEVLSDEFKKLFGSIQDSYDARMNCYNSNSLVGMAMLSLQSGWTYKQMFAELQKLKIFMGDFQVFEEEMLCQIDKLVVDPFILYFLDELGVLGILNNCKEIVVPYSTIQMIVVNLLDGEDTHLRQILKFIQNAINIKFQCPDFKMKLEYPDFFDKNMLQNCNNMVAITDATLLSAEKQLTYLYGDDSVHELSKIYKNNKISLLGFLKKSHQEDLLNDYTYGEIVLHMIDLNFEFLNIAYNDIYLAFKVSNFDIDNRMKKLLTIKVNADISSVTVVFSNLLRFLKQHGKSKELLTIASAMIEAMDKRYGRTHHSYVYAKESKNVQELTRIKAVRQECIFGIECIIAYLFTIHDIDEIRCIVQKYLKKVLFEQTNKIVMQAQDIFKQYLQEFYKT